MLEGHRGRDDAGGGSPTQAKHKGGHGCSDSAALHSSTAASPLRQLLRLLFSFLVSCFDARVDKLK